MGAGKIPQNENYNFSNNVLIFYYDVFYDYSQGLSVLVMQIL